MIFLRPVERRDGPALAETLSTQALGMPGAGKFSLEECSHLALQWEKDGRYWAIGQGDEMVGLLYGAALKERGPGQWELGYALRQDKRGLGLATQGCSLLLDWLFGSAGALRASAFCHPENHASRRLLKRLGLRKKKRRVKNGCFWMDASGCPRWQDAVEYTITNAAWRKYRNNLPLCARAAEKQEAAGEMRIEPRIGWGA